MKLATHGGILPVIFVTKTLECNNSCEYDQGKIKFRSNIPGLVDFVVGPVEFILHLPDRQVKVFGEMFL